MSGRVRLRDVSRPDREPLVHLENADLMALPDPLDGVEKDHAWASLSEQVKSKCECGLDDTCALSLPHPQTPRRRRAARRANFLSGLEKLFSRENNWTFLQPLVLTMEHCAKCQTCADSCHIFEASGGNELYRPTFRSEWCGGCISNTSNTAVCSPPGSTAISS